MKAKSGIYITFLPNHPNVLVSQKDHSVLDVALRCGVELDHTCGGNGTCGTCLIEVLEGLDKLEARSELEAEMAVDRGFSPQERLACQTQPVDGLIVRKRNSSKE